jgi:hypothetical protein
MGLYSKCTRLWLQATATRGNALRQRFRHVTYLNATHRFFTDIRKHCGTVSLGEQLTATRLRWLVHVVRMDEGRIPQVALFSSLHGVTKRLGVGRQLGGRIVYTVICSGWDSLIRWMTYADTVL